MKISYCFFVVTEMRVHFHSTEIKQVDSSHFNKPQNLPNLTTRHLFDKVKTGVNLNYIYRLKSYRAVNTPIPLS
jgi:hypothetical protein